MWTSCCPCSDRADTLWAQFWDGLLSVRIRSLASLGIPFGNLAATDGSKVFSSVIVITAASWRITTMNSSRLMWSWSVAIALFTLVDQWMSNQNSRVSQKAPPAVKQASPKLVNCGSRGITWPICISHLYNGFAIRLWMVMSSLRTAGVIGTLTFWDQSKAAISLAIRASILWWRCFGSSALYFRTFPFRLLYPLIWLNLIWMVLRSAFWKPKNKVRPWWIIQF